MSNDPRDNSGVKLQQALRTLGRNPELRAELIALLKQFESRLHYTAGAVRDDITGPIIDALHEEADCYEKTLTDGTRFQFLFRTKIARDFLLSDQEHPDHVWEPQTTRLMLDLARQAQGDVIVGGAYFGDQAILVAKAIAAQGFCLHGFEPNADQAEMFAQNVGLNALSNVRISGLGLWSTSSVKLKLDGFDSFANAIAANPDEEGFQTISIDNYRQQQGRRIGLIQLDIEGAELDALQGAHACLSTDKPDIVFEVHRSYVDWSDGLEKTEIVQYLQGLGYHLFAVRDFNSHRSMQGKHLELIPVDQVYLAGPPHGFNMLAVQDLTKLANYSIVKGVSPKLLAHKDPALHHPLDGLD